MKEFRCIVENPLGIHARPAALLAQALTNVSSTVTIRANGKEASGEVRLLQGDILVKDAVMTTRNAQMKLGRNKYAIEVVPQDDSYAEIRLGDVISSSWF